MAAITGIAAILFFSDQQSGVSQSNRPAPFSSLLFCKPFNGISDWRNSAQIVVDGAEVFVCHARVHRPGHYAVHAILQ